MATPNQFSSRADELSSALARFRLAADDLWVLINVCVSALPEKRDVEQSGNPFEAIRDLRTAVAPMRSFFKTLRDDHAILVDRERRLRRSLDGFEYHIDSSAMKYGLNRLPDELLQRIFFMAATSMESTLTLSHVCQRFRSIVTGTPSFWQRFRLSANWKEDQILTIAQRSQFRDLKADVWCGDWHYLVQDSALVILSLCSHLVELSLSGVHENNFFPIDRRLHFPRLRMLTYERLDDTGPLQLGNHLRNIFETPSLQVMKVDFIPHISLARNLIILILDLRFIRCQPELLVFLSSAAALEQLSVDARSAIDEQEMVEQAIVCLPKLTDLSFIMGYGLRTASIIALKIHAPSLRVLRLRKEGGKLENVGIQSIIGSNKHFTELHLSDFSRIDLCRIPARVETLALVDPWGLKVSGQCLKCSGSVDSLQLRLVSFYTRIYQSAEELYPYAIHLRNVLRDAGLDTVQIELPECFGCKPGTYNLEDVDLAFADSV